MANSDRDNDQPARRSRPVGPQLRNRHEYATGAPAKTLKSILDKTIMPMINTYKYQPIKYHTEIRILKIIHGLKDAPLECMLFTSIPNTEGNSTLNQQHDEYWALSYTWGNPNETSENKVLMYQDTGGRGDAQTMTHFNKARSFYIRDNLDAALRSFRRDTTDVNVWVDALCINQEDIVEKTAQVARMDEIYSAASMVCVWLGVGDNTTRDTFDFLRKILNLQELDRLIRTKEKPTDWLLVVNLMKNRWFSRRWVIQELALARNAIVRWGEEELTWPDFADAIDLFMNKYAEIQQIIGKPEDFSAMLDPSAHIGDLDPRALGAITLVNATSNLFRKSGDGHIQQRLLNIEVLVSCLFRPLEATEPKDTIYAVLSLAKDTSICQDNQYTESSQIIQEESVNSRLGIFATVLNGLFSVLRLRVSDRATLEARMSPPRVLDSRLVPDYSKSLTDVCADFMEYCIETSQSLDILCRHWAPKPKKLTKSETIQLSLKGREYAEEKLPSWIPSCQGHAFGAPDEVMKGRKNGDSLVGDLERDIQQYYTASAGLRPCVEFRKCQKEDMASATPTKKFDGTLIVKGFELNVIQEITGKVSWGIIPADAFEFSGWRCQSGDQMALDRVPDQLWRTLVADRGPNGTSAPTWYRRACLECLAHVNAEGDLNTRQFHGVPNTPSEMINFLQRVQQVTWSKRFFLTKGENPLFGFAPKNTKRDDIICILFGCSVPVVLRKVRDSENYEFIGECYVNGMMDGEAIRAQRKKLVYPYEGLKGFTLV